VGEEAIDCTIGHQGLAWGTGEHEGPAPAGFRTKREGDGCSPAGVFRIPFAFGMAPSAEGLRMPYTPLTPTIIGVDDPKSRYYNQVIDNTTVERDWDSNEAMMRHDKLYELGAFIANNPKNVPGGGSCIFFHVWPGPGKGTAGCTAMDTFDLQRVLLWLDPEKHPCLVQGLEGW
jgi:L,D-peptidoglycan transpeptidase YkuD (ErfK/YbiS/YcfS/YnhG family)